MTYFLALGLAGFLTIHLFDFVSLKKWPIVKPVTWVAGCGLLIYSLLGLVATGDRLRLASWASAAGWVMLAGSLLMLVWSLFINLPFRKTYIKKGLSGTLITTGLYSLVRHPGVHWFSLGMVALVLVSKSVQMLIAAPIFIFLDVLLVVIQDKVFFTRMFPGYPRYQQVTPMLIPNRRSFKVFINSLGNGIQH